MSLGYVKLKREPSFHLLKLLPGNEFKVYHLLMLRASFKARKFGLGNQVFTSEKGEVFIGLKGIAEGCSLEQSEIEPILRSLSDLGLIGTVPFMEPGEFNTLKNKVLNYEEIIDTKEDKHPEPERGDESGYDPF